MAGHLGTLAAGVKAQRPRVAGRALYASRAKPQRGFARQWSSRDDKIVDVTGMEAGNGPNVWLVLPTYNDSSPDGTGGIADRLAASYPDVSVIHRSRRQGLGAAYVAGFREALVGGEDLIAQMDADFSHDPADLPRLIDAVREADVALGSR